MKRILLGLSCTFIIPGGIFAQEHSPAARLGRPADPTIRAQAPDVRPAGFEVPKAMPKGTVTETPGVPSLPVPTPAPTPISGPGFSSIPGPTVGGPVITDATPPPFGAPIPNGPVLGSPVYGDPFGGYPMTGAALRIRRAGMSAPKH